jgi:benzoyl-CoA reductase/2-hydroxyglutaryl-CoA dehydratase subunit BcrC/BadD/HgdB
VGSDKKRSVKSLNTTRDLYKLIKEDYSETYSANFKKIPVAWVASYTPAEILVAMDVKRFYPENYAALCGAKQRSVDFQLIAENEGYNSALCSYFRTVTGALLSNESVLGHPLPLPDLLIATTCLCDAHLKWFQDISMRLNKPLFILDVPYNINMETFEEVDKNKIEYYKEQLNELVKFINKSTGQILDPHKLHKAITNSDQASELWININTLRKTAPCPMGSEDAFSNIYSLFANAGEVSTIKFYEKLYSEIKEKINHSQGVLDQERFRLMWDFIPQWYNMGLFNYFKEFGAVFVIEYFSLVWAARMSTDSPFESIARKYISIAWGNQPFKTKIAVFKKCIEEYKIDGVVMLSPWSCRPYLIGQLDLKTALEQDLDIPCLILETDFCDSRHYSSKQTELRIDAFMETLKAHRT